MTDSPQDDIRWFRSKLVAARFGTLDDVEETRFNALRDSNPACARLHEEFSRREPEPDPGDHLPAELIARWNKLAGTLQGREREMVMNHLERCDDCRDDLTALGFSVAPDSARAEPHSSRVIRIVRESASLWKQRVFAGWAVVASAAALVLALRIGTQVPMQVSQPVDNTAPPVAVAPDAGTVAPPAARTALSLANHRTAPLPVGDMARGGAADTLDYLLDPSEPYFEVDISSRVIPVGESLPVDLVLTDPNGVKTRQSSTQAALLDGQRLVVTNGGLPPVAGLYRLDIIEKDPAAAPIVQTVYFRVVNEKRR